MCLQWGMALRLHRFALLLLAMLMPTLTAFPQQANNNNDDSQTGSRTLDALANAMGAQNGNGDAVGTLQRLSRQIVTTVPTWSTKIRVTLQKEASGVYFAILPLVLIAELTFIGIRIMMRASIAEQILRLTTMTFILITVSYFLKGTFSDSKSVDENISSNSTNVFISAAQGLANAGRVIGKNIIVNNLSASSKQRPTLANLGSGSQSDMSMEPLFYWAAWIGSPPTREQATAPPQTLDPKTEYKYSVPSMMVRIWNDPTAAKSFPQYVKSSGGQGTSWLNLSDALAKMVQQGIYIFMPFQMIGTVFTIAQWQMGGFVAVVFGYLAIMVASTLVLDVVVALSMTLLPLIYFKSFEGLWSQLLTVITGLALIPCFYYIFSAIGFVFIDQLFDQLFPLIPEGESSNAQSFAVVLNACYVASVLQALAAVQSLLNVGYDLAEGLGNIFGSMVYLGKLLFGSMIVTVMVGAGVSFGAIAPGIALRWRHGFASEDLFGKITESLLGLQNAMGSGLGSLYADGISRAGSAIGGLGRGLAGRMTR